MKNSNLGLKTIETANECIQNIQKQITHACRSGRVLDELNISGLFLKELPPQAKLVRFARIKAGNNLFQEIPSYLSSITRLQSLDFRHNRLKKIPEFLHSLTCLRGINLSDNCIHKVPESVMKMNTITALNLSFNCICTFDVPPECLQNLDSLRLGYNKITSIDVQFCTKLLLLDCSHNPIANSTDMNVPYSLLSLCVDHVPMSSIPIGLDVATGLQELSWVNSGLEQIYGRGPSSTSVKKVKDIVTAVTKRAQYAKGLRCAGLANQECSLEINADIIKTGQKLQICGFLGDMEQCSILDVIVSNTSLVSLAILFSSLKNLPPMSHMKVLRHLNVSNNDFEHFDVPLPYLLTSLSISRCKMTEIGANVFCCKSLTSLDVSFNELASIPSEIIRLDALVQFCCDFCRLVQFPTPLLKMRSLAMISLRSNCITNSISDDIFSPGIYNDVIHCMDLSSNLLRQPPIFVKHLLSIRCCSMWNNPLQQPWVQFVTQYQTSKWVKLLQSAVSCCEMKFMKLVDASVLVVEFPQASNSLTELDISSNNLTILPRWLSTLKSLKLLSVRCNKLTSAASLAGCNGLLKIDLAFNQLRTLPQEAFDVMHELKEVTLDGNPLKHLPQILFSRKTLKTSIEWCILPVTNRRLLGDHSIKMSILHDLMKSLFSVQEGVSSIKLQGKRLTSIENAWFTNKLARLDTISSISVGSNMISEFPTCFTMLGSLTEVDISVNRLKELPQWMAKLRSLKKLICFSNMIKNINWDAAFESMREIDVSDNRLNAISEDLSMINFSAFSARYNSIDKMQSYPGVWGKTLEVLDLEYNSFSKLPLWISELTNLQYLNLEGNYLEHIPLELFSISTLQDLRLPSMEITSKTNRIDDEKEDIATPKSHSVHWLAVLKRLNESSRTFKMNLDDLSLMELPEQVPNTSSFFETIHFSSRRTLFQD
jgi:Leucine-rich repeat (LRR) protein